jgi:hypothetical protein
MASKDYDDFVTTMGVIFTTTAILTVLFFGLYFGIAQYEAGALNTW